jgi:ABC-2 type transport system permease protein
MAATNSLRTFAAISGNELLLNSKRVAPYVMAVLFGGNAWLWLAKGAAVSAGWGTNSDFYIFRNYAGFNFITGLPIFTAIIMGDPIIRDFRFGISPLVFSKPLTRATYILGKFFGNFLALTCCLAFFGMTLFAMQWIHTSKMVVLPVQVFPYFKHFFFVVVVSQMFLAACFFTVGSLTRNTKIVYGLAVAFYPLYIAYQLFAKNFPWLRIVDPFGFNHADPDPWHRTPEFLNQYVIPYNSYYLGNRAIVVLLTAICLGILLLRFTISERAVKEKPFAVIDLTTVTGQVYYVAPENIVTVNEVSFRKAIPAVRTANDGFRGALYKLLAATSMELRLLRSERSLIVLVPLAIVLCTLEVAFFPVVPQFSFSATYAAATATSMIIFLVGFSIFYTGEAMHRDRELRAAQLVCATPAPDGALLYSKFLATLLLLISLILSTGIASIMIQVVRRHTPIDAVAYVKVYGAILMPGAVFVTAVALLVNVLLRNKYLGYVISSATAAGLFYAYGIGYHHWAYNPFLFHLSNYTAFANPGVTRTMALNRLYWLGISFASLALAHPMFRHRWRVER